MKVATISTVLISLLVASHGKASEDIGLPEIHSGDREATNLLKRRLTAWKAEDGREIDNWDLQNRILRNTEAGAHIITKQEFRDFDLSLQFRLPPGGNSGVYLRGRYEIQLHDGQDAPPIKYTGAVWGQIPVETKMYKGPNIWNEMQVRVKGNQVSVVVNRKPVIRSQQFKGPTRGAINQNESAPGPILLQCLKGAQFRNIMIKEL